MASTNIADLVDSELVQAGPLATVTREFVIIRSQYGNSHTIIAVERLSGIRRITTTYPALIVISAGLFLIAAAAFYSKEGSGAGPPMAFLGASFAVGYYLSRRAAVAFRVGGELTETASGSPSEAANLIKAVQSAQEFLRRASLEG